MSELGRRGHPPWRHDGGGGDVDDDGEVVARLVDEDVRGVQVAPVSQRSGLPRATPKTGVRDAAGLAEVGRLDEMWAVVAGGDPALLAEEGAQGLVEARVQDLDRDPRARGGVLAS